MLLNRIWVPCLFSLLIGCSVASGPTVTAPVSEFATTDALSFVEALNEVRGDKGYGPLRLDAGLTAAAQDHAADMADRNYFAHVNLDGQTHSARIRAAGGGTCASGETIAYGEPSAQSVLSSWLGSGAHAAILLRGSYQRLGLGNDGDIWVATVARDC